MIYSSKQFRLNKWDCFGKIAKCSPTHFQQKRGDRVREREGERQREEFQESVSIMIYVFIYSHRYHTPFCSTWKPTERKSFRNGHWMELRLHAEANALIAPLIRDWNEANMRENPLKAGNLNPLKRKGKQWPSSKSPYRQSYFGTEVDL